MHRVLKISTENAFCLHSKERVPFHIIVEVAYDPEEEVESEEEEKELSGVDGANDNPFLEDARKGGLKIKELKIKSVEKLKSLAAGGLGKSEQKAIELTGTRKSNSNKGSGAG